MMKIDLGWGAGIKRRVKHLESRKQNWHARMHWLGIGFNYRKGKIIHNSHIFCLANQGGAFIDAVGYLGR